MKRTALTVLTNEEFVGYLSNKQNKTEIETEAEQRLILAIDRIHELENPHGNHARGQSESRLQASA